MSLKFTVNFLLEIRPLGIVQHMLAFVLIEVVLGALAEERSEVFLRILGWSFSVPGKSTLWTNTGQDQNFWTTFRTIGPYQFRGKLIWTNHWSIPFPGEIRMDQWSWKFFKSFPLHWYWSMDGSSQCPFTLGAEATKPVKIRSRWTDTHLF